MYLRANNNVMELREGIAIHIDMYNLFINLSWSMGLKKAQRQPKTRNAFVIYIRPQPLSTSRSTNETSFFLRI